MIDQLLRPFVCDQLKALMEKLETQELDARSLKNLGGLINELELTLFERYVVRRVYKRVRRMHDMNRIIEEVVIGQGQYNINMDLNTKLRAAMDSGHTDSGVMWNGEVPVEQKKRLVIRPKASV